MGPRQQTAQGTRRLKHGEADAEGDAEGVLGWATGLVGCCGVRLSKH